MAKCGRKDCQKDGATLVPVLQVRPEGYTAAPALLILQGLFICDACAKKHTDAEAFICDEGWEKIVTSFRALGKAEPHRPSTKLLYQRVGVDVNDLRHKPANLGEASALNRIRKYFN